MEADAFVAYHGPTVHSDSIVFKHLTSVQHQVDDELLTAITGSAAKENFIVRIAERVWITELLFRFTDRERMARQGRCTWLQLPVNDEIYVLGHALAKVDDVERRACLRRKWDLSHRLKPKLQRVTADAHFFDEEVVAAIPRDLEQSLTRSEATKEGWGCDFLIDACCHWP